MQQLWPHEHKLYQSHSSCLSLSTGLTVHPDLDDVVELEVASSMTCTLSVFQTNKS